MSIKDSNNKVLQKVNELSFKQQLVNYMGYITADMMPDAKTVLGENFEVVTKDFYGNRCLVPLKDVNSKDQNLRSVFVASHDYHQLLSEWGMEHEI